MVIRFPAYRRFSASRIEVNDAMMALLIGARLGEHALRTTAASPHALLPSLFGQIPGIQRLNRTAGDAARLLERAETHLAYMAIPYALAVHASFAVAAAEMVREGGLDAEGGERAIARQQDLAKLPLDIAHQYIAERCGRELDQTLLELFGLTRRVRNRIVHSGGVAGSRLASEYRVLPKDTRVSWEELAGRPLPAAIVDDKLALEEGELVAVLAISRNLAQDLNDLMARTLSRDYWAAVAVRDYRDLHPQRFGERARRLQRVRGHAQRLYNALHLTEEELRAAGA